VGPAVAFFATRRICLGLQRHDREELLHGYESGIIRQLPDGQFTEAHRPVDADRRAVLEAKHVPALLPAPGAEDVNGVPAPASRGVLGKMRTRANRAFAETIIAEPDGHGDGHGNGHGAQVTGGEEYTAIGSGSSAEADPPEHRGDAGDSAGS
ncbi:MAG: hypothetical protein JO132_07830, partial [Streptosporangiaceae bacterium]|nr:hypothetical protein [Streptosporangiaceae bacterium]